MLTLILRFYTPFNQKYHKTMNIQEEDLKAFNKAFREFDKDSSGKMNYTEVGNFMKFLRDEDIDETELQEVLKDF